MSFYIHVIFHSCLLLYTFIAFLFQKEQKHDKMDKTLKTFYLILWILCYYPLLEEYFRLWTLRISALPFLEYVCYFVIHPRLCDPSRPFGSSTHDLVVSLWLYYSPRSFDIHPTLFLFILWLNPQVKECLFWEMSNACSILWLVHLHTQRLSLRLPYNETFYFMSFNLCFRIVSSYPSYFFNF